MTLTLILTPMTLVIIFTALLMSWTRRDSASRESTLLSLLSERDRAYDELVRTTFLGLPASPEPTTTITPPSSNGVSLSPEEQFDLLSPEIQGDLLREYEEHLGQYGTLSGKPPRTSPMVEQIQPNVIGSVAI